MSEVSACPGPRRHRAPSASTPRWSPELDAKIAAATERLRDAAATHGAGAVQSTSLGVEDMVVTDLIARAQLPIAIATLDTGRLHAETLA